MCKNPRHIIFGRRIRAHHSPCVYHLLPSDLCPAAGLDSLSILSLGVQPLLLHPKVSVAPGCGLPSRRDGAITYPATSKHHSACSVTMEQAHEVLGLN